MTIPGSGGRMRFDGTLTIGNLLIILSMAASVVVFLVWLGAAFRGIRDTQAQNQSAIAVLSGRVTSISGRVDAIQGELSAVEAASGQKR